MLLGLFFSCQEGAGVELRVEDALLAKEALVSLEEALSLALSQNRICYEKSAPAGVVFEVLQSAGAFGFEGYPVLTGTLQSVVDLLQLLQSMGGRESGKGISTLLGVLKTVYTSADPALCRASLDTYYRLQVRKCTRHANNAIFELWCFHPGFSMKSLANSGIREGQEGEGVKLRTGFSIL